MTEQDIRDALLKGKDVFWRHDHYKVSFDGNGELVVGYVNTVRNRYISKVLNKDLLKLCYII